MSERVLRSAVVLPLIAVLAACGSAPEITRAPGFQQFAERGALGDLARRFQAETPSVVLFDFDSHDLDAEAIARLDVQAEWILRHPEVRFRIAGHTDKVGSNAYNDALGLRRATAALNYLVSRGVDARRLEAMASFGEDAPIIDTDDPERTNRRVTTYVMGWVEEPEDEIESSGEVMAQALVPVNGIEDAEIVDEPVAEPTSEPTAEPDPEPTPDPEPEEDTSNGTGSTANSGRGNGDEGSDPGKSGDKNNGGDEV